MLFARVRRFARRRAFEGSTPRKNPRNQQPSRSEGRGGFAHIARGYKVGISQRRELGSAQEGAVEAGMSKANLHFSAPPSLLSVKKARAVRRPNRKTAVPTTPQSLLATPDPHQARGRPTSWQGLGGRAASEANAEDCQYGPCTRGAHSCHRSALLILRARLALVCAERRPTGTQACASGAQRAPQGHRSDI